MQSISPYDCVIEKVNDGNFPEIVPSFESKGFALCLLGSVERLVQYNCYIWIMTDDMYSKMSHLADSR